MTTREQLHDWIDVLDEARAEALLAELESEFADDREFPPLTPEEWERVERSIEQADKGLTFPHDEIRRRLGLDKGLAEDLTRDDVGYRTYLREAIEQGRRDIREGRVFTTDEVRKNLGIAD